MTLPTTDAPMDTMHADPVHETPIQRDEWAWRNPPSAQVVLRTFLHLETRVVMPFTLNIRAAAAIVIGAAGLTAVGCGSSGGSTTTLNLVTSAPKLTDVNYGSTTGSSIGDYVIFQATATKDGAPFGYEVGEKLLVAVPGTFGTAAGKGLYQNQFTFVLPAGEIICQGTQVRAIAGGEAGEVDVRAIVGGTGTYANARGTVTSTTLPNGSRTQKLVFSN
jgi:hypothetical protein